MLKWYTYLGDSPDDCLVEPVPTPEQYKALQNVMNGEFNNVEDAIIETAEYIAAHEPAPPAPAPSQGRDAKSPRSLIFKPFTLTAGCSPLELTRWLKRFRGVKW